MGECECLCVHEGMCDGEIERDGELQVDTKNNEPNNQKKGVDKHNGRQVWEISNVSLHMFILRFLVCIKVQNARSIGYSEQC